MKSARMVVNGVLPFLVLAMSEVGRGVKLTEPEPPARKVRGNKYAPHNGNKERQRRLAKIEVKR